MSVFHLSNSAQTKLFNEYVLPGVNIEVRENSKLYGRFKSDTQHSVGKYSVFKAMVAFATSARPSSTSELPAPKQGTYDEFILYMKRGMYAQLQFDGLTMACQKGKGAVVDVLQQEIENISIYMANKLNKQFWGDGSGRLAQLYAAVSNSVTAIVDGPYFGQDSNEYTNPANYLEEGMDVDFYSTAGALEDENNTISAIVDNEDGTATLTMSRALTATNNAYIFDHDTYAASQAAGTGVPQGLMGIIDDADPYTGITQTDFQNVDRGTYKWARAQVVDMGSVAITSAKMLKLVHQVERYGRVKALWTNDIIWRSYYQILESDKTMPNQKAYWGGLEGLAFYGGRKGAIPILYDTDCPDNRMFAIDDAHLAVYAPTESGLTWLPGDNGILTRIQGKDESTASLVWYYNFGCRKPQAQGVLENIKHAAS